LTLDPRDGGAVVVLGHDASQRYFPIWLADKEAHAIARALDGRPTQRPDTHDLAHTLITAFGARVRRARITGVAGGVVHAQLVVAHADEDLIVDARPSDAIVLALFIGAPIVVDDGLLEQVAARVREAEARVAPTTTKEGAEPLAQSHAERWGQILAHLSHTGARGDDRAV
jgi:bifunctional DNase/RNase